MAVSLRHVLAVLLSLFFAASSADGQSALIQPPQLLDVNPGPASSSPGKIVDMNGIAYFSATHPFFGNELFRSDGTPQGTYPVADINPGAGSSFIDYLMTTGDRLYFSASDGIRGAELWVSDGTPAGTRLVRDIIPGPQSSVPRHITAFGNGVVLSACTVPSGCEVWKSDGTPPGTVMLRDIRPGSQSAFPEGFIVLGSNVLFQANDGINGQELWKTNGTPQGTVLVKNIDTHPLVSETDGRGRAYPSDFVIAGGVAYFKAKTVTQGYELWRSDGTANGTQLVRDVLPGSLDGVLEMGVEPSLLAFDNQIFFMARTFPNGPATPFVSDGSFAGTVSTILPSSLERAKLDDFFYLSGPGLEPWVWSSPQSFQPLPEVTPGPLFSDPKGFFTAGNHVYFSANDQVTGVELWRAALMNNEMVSLGDINPGALSSSPAKFVRVGNNLLFTATGPMGLELYSFRLNRPPVADAGPDQIVPEDWPVTLNGSASHDPDLEELFYEWRDANGVAVGYDATIHLLLPRGLYDFTLTVKDREYSATDTVRVRVGNNRPPAADPGGPYSGVRNTPIVFDASGSTDPDNEPLSYWWDFGAGPIAGSVTMTHSFPYVGTAPVLLWVCDTEQACDGPVFIPVTITNVLPTVVPGGPYSGVRHVPVSFDGSGTFDADNDALTFVWDFGDGTFAAGVSVAHVYTALGEHQVTLAVTDGFETVNEYTTVNITNRAPVAHAGGPYTGVRAIEVMFDGSQSVDPDGDVLSYSWDFGEGPPGAGVAPGHGYLALGTYPVTLTVTDGHGGSATATTTVTITNRAPAAHAGGPYSGGRNSAIAFDGAASSDPDTDTLTYAWDFGDGSTGTGVSPSHSYSSLGAFTVTLIVNDGTDNSAPATATVTVFNRDPVAAAGGPYTGYRNEPIAFNGSGSSDPDGDELTYHWDFGYGGAPGSGASPTYAYDLLGQFNVLLTVTDPSGQVSSSPTTVTINNRIPVASAGGPYEGLRNAPIAFNASASSDGDNDALTYSWDFGDGSTGSGVSPAHAYAASGSYTARLVVNDGYDNSEAAAITVTVTNGAPTAHAGGPYQSSGSGAITFNGAGSSDPDADPLTYAWDFGDGSVGTGVSPSHTYTTTGTFVVTLVVNDGLGGSTPHTATVTIANGAPSVALTSPNDGAVFYSAMFVTIAATATDDGSVTKVEFFANGSKIGEDTVAPYSMPWSSAPGSYVLVARATDSWGAVTDSASRTITINATPTATITSPANMSQHYVQAPMTVTADAADADGTVVQVEFFRGSTSLGVDTTSPYSITWTPTATGGYTLTAVATDNLGHTGTSGQVLVSTVTNVHLLTALADTYVRASAGGAGFGMDPWLTVQQGSSNSNIRWTYLKFDMSQILTVSNAKIRLSGAVSAVTSTPITTAVYPVANTTWTEGMTWNTRPATGASPLSTVAIVTNSTSLRYYDLDVTAYLQAEKAAGRNVVTLALKNLANSTPYVQFVSRTGTPIGNRPLLMITR